MISVWYIVILLFFVSVLCQCGFVAPSRRFFDFFLLTFSNSIQIIYHLYTHICRTQLFAEVFLRIHFYFSLYFAMLCLSSEIVVCWTMLTRSDIDIDDNAHNFQFKIVSIRDSIAVVIAWQNSIVWLHLSFKFFVLSLSTALSSQVTLTAMRSEFVLVWN